MSGIKDSEGNPLQINAIYRNLINHNVELPINLKYLGYNHATRTLKFQLDNGTDVFRKIDGPVNNNYVRIYRFIPSVGEPPSAKPTQPDISEEKGGKRKKSRKSRKSKKSRKSRR
jgi:hypothetical protein